MQNRWELDEIWLKWFYRSISMYLHHFSTNLDVFELILMGKPMWVAGCGFLGYGYGLGMRYPRVTHDNPYQCLSRSEPLTRMRMAEHTSSLWVPLQHLSRSEPLTRMTEHTSSLWVVWADHKTTDGNGWTHIQLVSHSPVFEQIRTMIGMSEHTSSLWVTLQCLSRSEPLIRIAACWCAWNSSIHRKQLFLLFYAF